MNTDVQEFTDMVRVVQNLKLSRVRLLPYHPLGLAKYAMLGRTCAYGECTAVDKAKLRELQSIAQSAGLQCTVE